MGGDSKNDSDVRAAVQSAFTNNGSLMGTSYYVDYEDDIVGTSAAAGPFPSDAAGVQANGNRTSTRSSPASWA